MNARRDRLAALAAGAGVRSRMRDESAEGPIAQRLEPPAHNRLVPGSNPGGPTALKGRWLRGEPIIA